MDDYSRSVDLIVPSSLRSRLSRGLLVGSATKAPPAEPIVVVVTLVEVTLVLVLLLVVVPLVVARRNARA